MKTTRRGLFGWFGGAVAAASGAKVTNVAAPVTVYGPPMPPEVLIELPPLDTLGAHTITTNRRELWEEYVRECGFKPYMGSGNERGEAKG